jgi:hypothetical protein
MNWINYCACGLTVAVAGSSLVRARRDGRGAGPRYLSAFFVCLGLGLAVMAPPTLVLAARFEPVPNLARLVGNGLEMAAAYFLGALGCAIATPERTRRWLRWHGAALATAVAAMGVLLVVADVPPTLNFVNAYSREPAVVAYLVIFFCFVAGSLVAFLAAVGGYVRHVEPRVLRTGLRFVVAGAVVGIAWAAWSGVRPVITLATGKPLATSLPVGSVIGAVCVLLWLIGATLTAWGPRLTAPLRWARAMRRYRQVGPVWTAVRTALPQVELASAASLETGAEFALYRRVIEIRDAQLLLRPYAHPDVPAWVGPGGDPATREAALIAAGLVGYAAGRRYAADHEFSDVDPSLESESAWLARVSRAFTSAGAVDRVRRLAAAALEPVARDGAG